MYQKATHFKTNCIAHKHVHGKYGSKTTDEREQAKRKFDDLEGTEHCAREIGWIDTQ